MFGYVAWLALALGSAIAFADEPADRAVAQAHQLVERMKAFDGEGVAALTYTHFFAAMGIDPELPKKAAAQLNEKLKSAGARYTRFELKAAQQPFASDGRLYIFIPYASEMDAKGRHGSQEAFFIGVSEDGGKSWTFVDGVNATQESILAIIPSYSGEALPTRRVRPLE